jgi:hypothetical protein
MATKRYVDLNKRKLNFNRVELTIYVALAVIFGIILLYNILASELFAWPGWFIAGVAILIAVTIRNIFYIRQLSAFEFLKPETYQRYQFNIALALLGYVFSIFMLPGNILQVIMSGTFFKPWNFLVLFFAGLILGLIGLIFNLHFPIRRRELELVDEEREQVKKWRQDLDDQLAKFRGTGELPLLDLTTPGNQPPVDVDTMTAIRERMDYIIKYLDHVRRNQYVIIARYDVTEVKLLKSQVALRLLLWVSVFLSIRILILI